MRQVANPRTRYAGAVRTATEGYREEMDVLAGFIDDCCILSKEAFANSK